MVLSPILTFLFGKGCRFTPTCSNYTIEAVNRFGLKKGIPLAVKRIIRCNPSSEGGYDPVPKKI